MPEEDKTSQESASAEMETSVDVEGQASEGASETIKNTEAKPEKASATQNNSGSTESSAIGDVEVPDLPDFSNMLAEAAASSIDMLNDVELDVKIELGRTEMAVRDVLELTNGSVVELDKLAGDPVDIRINEQLVARGEVLVVNDNFCVRINEIVPGLSEQIVKIE